MKRFLSLALMLVSAILLLSCSKESAKDINMMAMSHIVNETVIDSEFSVVMGCDGVGLPYPDYWAISSEPAPADIIVKDSRGGEWLIREGEAMSDAGKHPNSDWLPVDRMEASSVHVVGISVCGMDYTHSPAKVVVGEESVFMIDF